MGSRTPQVPRPSKPRVPDSSSGGRASLTLAARFKLFVDARNSRGCFPWLGKFNAYGYGILQRAGKNQLAHRLAWELANQTPPPPGAVIRHICNTRWCVNPRHLRAGTHADNMRDKVVAGRQAKGHKNGRAKIDSDEMARVLIRRMKAGERKTDLAIEFGVSRRALRFLESGKNWAHVHAKPVQQRLIGAA